jgi:hypothetical protein
MSLPGCSACLEYELAKASRPNTRFHGLPSRVQWSNARRLIAGIQHTMRHEHRDRLPVPTHDEFQKAVIDQTEIVACSGRKEGPSAALYMALNSGHTATVRVDVVGAVDLVATFKPLFPGCDTSPASPAPTENGIGVQAGNKAQNNSARREPSLNPNRPPHLQPRRYPSACGWRHHAGRARQHRSNAVEPYDLHDSFCHPRRATLQSLSVLRPLLSPTAPAAVPPQSPVGRRRGQPARPTTSRLTPTKAHRAYAAVGDSGKNWCAPRRRDRCDGRQIEA